MNTTLRLHYAPDNASLCVRLALEELGLPYETALVDRLAKAQRSAPYLALNPNGLIPVLETPQGPIFETGAILMWLADTHGALMPGTEDPNRAHAVQWMFWLSNTLHTTQRMLFYPDQFTDGDVSELSAPTRARLIQKLDVLSAATTADWLDSPVASAHGCYLGPLLRWCTLYGGGHEWFDLARWPRLMDFAGRAEQRPAAQRAALAEGLGLTPFSAPSPCNPPEGSAL
ncbi:glutathione S-transferase family protein [Loktanella agnita]|uniref:glutathione S-transferase family protein n=1 Tax=Loktanella agnita TaxID=287097 RepID=UPI0039899FAB